MLAEVCDLINLRAVRLGRLLAMRNSVEEVRQIVSGKQKNGKQKNVYLQWLPYLGQFHKTQQSRKNKTWPTSGSST